MTRMIILVLSLCLTTTAHAQSPVLFCMSVGGPDTSTRVMSLNRDGDVMTIEIPANDDDRPANRRLGIAPPEVFEEVEAAVVPAFEALVPPLQVDACPASVFDSYTDNVLAIQYDDGSVRSHASACPGDLVRLTRLMLVAVFDRRNAMEQTEVEFSPDLRDICRALE